MAGVRGAPGAGAALREGGGRASGGHPRTYDFGTGGLVGPLRAYCLDTWGARVLRNQAAGPFFSSYQSIVQ